MDSPALLSLSESATLEVTILTDALQQVKAERLECATRSPRGVSVPAAARQNTRAAQMKVAALVVLCSAGAHLFASKMVMHRRGLGSPGVVAWVGVVACALGLSVARLFGAIAQPLWVRADWEPRRLARTALPLAVRAYSEARLLQATSIDTYFVLRALLLPAIVFLDAPRLAARVACGRGGEARGGKRRGTVASVLALLATCLFPSLVFALLSAGSAMYLGTAHPLGADSLIMAIHHFLGLGNSVKFVGYDGVDVMPTGACALWLALWCGSALVDSHRATARARMGFSSTPAAAFAQCVCAAALIAILPSGAFAFVAPTPSATLGEAWHLAVGGGDSSAPVPPHLAGMRWERASALGLLGASAVFGTLLLLATTALQREASSKLASATANVGIVAALLYNVVAWECVALVRSGARQRSARAVAR